MKDREQFCFIVARTIPAATFNEVTRMLQLARGVQRLAVAECNRQLTEREKARQAKLASAVLDLAKGWGIVAHITGDPRGYVVKLMLPGGHYNTWGGPESGWGVPS